MLLWLAFYLLALLPRCFPQKGIPSGLGTEDPVSLWEHTTERTRSTGHEITVSISKRGRDRPKIQASLIRWLLLPPEGLLALPWPDLVCLCPVCPPRVSPALLVSAGWGNDQVMAFVLKERWQKGPHSVCDGG